MVICGVKVVPPAGMIKAEDVALWWLALRRGQLSPSSD